MSRMSDAVEIMELMADQQDGYLVLMVQSGSRAYGTDHANSDYDFRGVYIAGLQNVLGLSSVPTSFSQSDPDDVTVYELHHFCKLAASGNPTLLEMLWAPDPLLLGRAGSMLVEKRDLFLSKRIYSAYRGYSLAQRSKCSGSIFGPPVEGSRKARLHCIRLLVAGIVALQGDGVPVRLNAENVATANACADLPPTKFAEIVLMLEDQLLEAHRASPLPDSPDRQAIDALIAEIRLNA